MADYNLSSVASGAELDAALGLALSSAQLTTDQVWTARQTFPTLFQAAVTVADANIDVSLGNLFSKTITVNTAFTVSNVPASGKVASFTLSLTNGGAYSVTWWSGVRWPAGVAPTLSNNATDEIGFITYDGGSTWIGLPIARNINPPWWLVAGISASQVVAAYQPKGAVDLAASYVNLANPGTYDAQVGVAPTLESSGWVFNGTTQYLLGPPSSNAGFAVRFSDVSGLFHKTVFGVIQTGSGGISFRDTNGANRAYGNDSTTSMLTGSAGSSASGVALINRNNGAFNGIIEVNSLPDAYAGSENYGISVRRVTTADPETWTYQACKIQACCSFAPGTTLTADQIAALSAAMAAL